MSSIRLPFSSRNSAFACSALALLLCAFQTGLMAGTIAQTPLYLGQSSTPLILITMERDHKLYYEAYNDASDINGDGALDIHYKPAIDYYGYFDSHKCYSYSSGVFTPVENTLTKKCTSSTGRWSGDFLNYLTMSRMDALRRVLYGGYRSTDSATETVLERSYIPQDAHSWGKEYNSTTIDGYNITEYTPLSLPAAGTRHLFANTTLLCPSGNSDPGCSSNSGLPLLRVLTDTTYRVWEWLSIERPVAGVECATGNNSRATCANSSGTYTGYAGDASGFATMETLFANSSHQQGSGTPSNGRIDGSGNPYGDDDYYLNIFTGSILVSTSGSYQFAVDGDDAVDVIIDGTVVASWYGGHGNCNCQDHKGTISLTAGTHTLKFRHQEASGGDNYYLWWNGPDSSNTWVKVPSGSFIGLTQTTYSVTLPTSAMTDYVVRVKACVSGLLESECRGYPSNTSSPSVHKPSGILQEYGEGNRMAFGLMTGSYAKNTSGGVLRKNISYLADSAHSADQEINTTTGQFSTSVNGVIQTINKLKIVGFGSSYSYDQSCGVPEVSAPLAEGRCRMWGNPIGEIMYEGLRYFAANPISPTTAFSIASTGTDDTTLGLPLPSWKNPYRNPSDATDPGFPSCSRPSQLVISDINPNFDTDQVPGTYFATYTGSLTGLNVQTLGNTIWTGEYGSATPSLFIGQSGSTFDGAPTPKTVSSFGNIRGLTPEEPTQQGGFYAASVALYGKTTDLNSASGNQKTDTFSVALASPLPRLQLPVNGRIITLVPFGKTVGGCGTINTASGQYQPTNTIVDFYVDTIKNTDATNQDATVNGGRAYAKFRINYEDSEYGSDHDMDAIVEYELIAKSDNTLDVKLTSGYAAGGCIQHMGYVISGSTTDGTYLEVRDSDTTSDVDYFLDTPNTSGAALPLITTRNFTPGTNPSAAFIAHDPLWYAAKWGGFFDTNSNNRLDAGEWDTAVAGTPDSYFLVTNAGRLKEQLDAAFSEIVRRNTSSSSVAANSTFAGTDTLIYQARFNSGDWSGELRAFVLNADGSVGSQAWTTNRSGAIPSASTRKIYSYNPTTSGGIRFCWDATGCPGTGSGTLSTTQKTTLGTADIVDYLRGDQSKETTHSGGTFRARDVLLGDVVNSDPWFVGTRSFGYESLPSTEGTSYVTFRSSDAYKNRRPVLYVGANDGMLHGFDATNSTTSGGTEIFAYVPNSVISTTLKTLSAQGYTHTYFVDGSARSGDAYYSGSWHTILIGTTGAGGKGVFALDVTDPDAFGTTKVLWEFTDNSDADMGIAMTQATIVRLANGDWGAIFGNGYNSASGKAVLYIVNVATGAIIKKIDTGATGSNGLSAPIVIDLDNDRIADFVYAGDLRGNMWKFNIYSTSTSDWGVAYSTTTCASSSACNPLYQAKDTASTPASQPISVKPQVGRATGRGQTSGVNVYFGTGKYFEVGDNILPASPQVQTFYGIWDKCNKPITVTSPTPTPAPGTADAADCDGRVSGRTVLQQQQITNELIAGTCLRNPDGSCSTELTENPVRVTTDNSFIYGTGTTDKKGWYIDLLTPPPPGTANGERVVSNPLLRGDRIIFPTLIPSTDPCTFGGSSWLMELDANSGGRLNNSFDLNNSGSVNAKDYVLVNSATGSVGAASGVKSPVGIIKTPAVVEDSMYGGGTGGAGGGGACTETKYVSGSSGELFTQKEACSKAHGRLSWRQIR
ncbi:PilC/PilY family type IV pilus protein [Methyloterricola oryzae]|uniref:PilC/PilY family type IV pilus protein n=1 Tax=Methyloterricola oryzae TaxID=1495050 RepID=UPI0009E50D9A|nr:PilC/PilY family type IV pilus protein [Methyloterricola oryzae]